MIFADILYIKKYWKNTKKHSKWAKNTTFWAILSKNNNKMSEIWPKLSVFEWNLMIIGRKWKINLSTIIHQKILILRQNCLISSKKQQKLMKKHCFWRKNTKFERKMLKFEIFLTTTHHQKQLKINKIEPILSNLSEKRLKLNEKHSKTTNFEQKWWKNNKFDVKKVHLTYCIRQKNPKKKAIWKKKDLFSTKNNQFGRKNSPHRGYFFR